MKKSISNTQLKKVIKYISPEELKFQEEHWGKVPETYWEKVDMWYKFLYNKYPNYKIDHFVLAIILLEMQSYYNLYARIYEKKFTTDQVCNNGVNGLLESLGLFNANFLNIESINIKVKHFKPLTKDDKAKTFESLTAHDAIIRNIKIEGKEVIIELYKLINNNRGIFQKISDREEKYDNTVTEIQKRNKPDNYLRKRYSLILHKYLKEHLPNRSHNKLCTIGGFLLFVMGLMPSQPDLSTKRKFHDYLRKNFKRVLPPNIKSDTK